MIQRMFTSFASLSVGPAENVSPPENNGKPAVGGTGDAA
jgi:hypothetical protein